jgi:hypothetical protein
MISKLQFCLTQIVQGMHTMVTDTTPAFIEAGLLPVIRNILQHNLYDETGKELLIRCLHTLTNSPFAVEKVMQDAELCEAVVETALAEAYSWCALQEREQMTRTMGTDSNIEVTTRATRRAAQALYALANLLEAGIQTLRIVPRQSHVLKALCMHRSCCCMADSAQKTIVEKFILSKHPDIVNQIAALMQHGYDEASCVTELHKRADLEVSTALHYAQCYCWFCIPR